MPTAKEICKSAIENALNAHWAAGDLTAVKADVLSAFNTAFAVTDPAQATAARTACANAIGAAVRKFVQGETAGRISTLAQSITDAIDAFEAGTSQPANTNLAALAGLVGAADKMFHFTGAGTMVLATLTAAGRALNEAADAAAQRTVLGAAAPNGLATLGADGKVPSDQLSPLAITEAFVVVSQAAMLALTAQRGDIAVRTDLNRSFVLSTDDPTILADWIELRTPTDAVLSVAGKTGVVTINKNDVGLGDVDNTSDTDKPVSTAQAAALATKANLAGATFTGNVGVGGAPSTQVDVINPNAGSNANFRVRGDGQGTGVGAWYLDVFSGTSGHGLYGYGNKDFLIGVAGITRLIVAHATGALTAVAGNSIHTFLRTGTSGGGVIKVRNTSNNGYSFVDMFDDTDVKRGGFGYANASSGGASAGKAYFYTISKRFFVSTDNGATEHVIVEATTGQVGVGVAPTAAVHVKAGTAAAGTAPIKLSAGTNLTSPETGAIEFDGSNLYFTIAGVRKTVVLV